MNFKKLIQFLKKILIEFHLKKNQIIGNGHPELNFG